MIVLTSEQVDIVDMCVGPPKPLDDRWRNLAAEPIKVVCPGQVANGPVEVVPWQAVVATSLKRQMVA